MQEESRELENADITSEQNKNTQCDDGMKFSLKDGITIYEGKIATIIVSSIITLMFSLVMYSNIFVDTQHPIKTVDGEKYYYAYTTNNFTDINTRI